MQSISKQICYKVKCFFYILHFKVFSIPLRLLSVLSLIMMVVIRYISKVLVWILTVLVIIGSVGNRRDSAGTLKQQVSGGGGVSI